MLEKSGIEVTIASTTATATNTANNKIKKEKSLFSLLPIGSNLVPKGEQTQHQSPFPFRIDHLNLSPQEGNLLKPEEQEKAVSLHVDSDSIDWELNTKGEDLLQESEKIQWQEVSIDTSAIDFSDPEKPLTPPSKTVAQLIKTDHLSLEPLEEVETKQ